MRIAQLSDSHVRAAGRLYKGVVDSNAMLAAAVEAVNALRPPVDLVLLTGDVVDDDDGKEDVTAAYAMATSLLAPLEAPLLAIPGNHDDRPSFRQHFPNPGYHHHHDDDSNRPLHFVRDDCGPLRIIGFDVTVPHHHHGEVTKESAQWLEEILADDASSSRSSKPTIIMMHQPPFDCGIPYLDTFAFQHADRLANILVNSSSGSSSIERIVCGHVHRSMQLTFAKTSTCTAPSTTTAIALRLGPPDAKEASYIEPPAFLLHHWNADGEEQGFMITHHVPIGTFPGPYAFA